jgi:hypothetical protein
VGCQAPGRIAGIWGRVLPATDPCLSGEHRSERRSGKNDNVPSTWWYERLGASLWISE